jgi:hypothetical protein
MMDARRLWKKAKAELELTKSALDRALDITGQKLENVQLSIGKWIGWR